MKVYFNYKYPAGKDQLEYNNVIRETLKKCGVDIVSLDDLSYQELLGEDVVKKLGGVKSRETSGAVVHYAYIKKGLSISNAAVFEITESDFRLGHEATLSILYNKPVLCLSRKRDFSDDISDYISHPLFYAKMYQTKDELRDIVQDYINEYRKKYLYVRFNGYISPEQKNFLDWFGKRTKRNASEIIRDLIDEKITENDEFHSRDLVDLPKSL